MRTLRLSKRPFIALGIVLGVPALAILILAAFDGKLARELPVLVLFPALYLFIVLSLCGTRISLSAEELVITRGFFAREVIPLRDLLTVDLITLMEPAHPAFVTVAFRKNGSPRSVTLSMKPYLREDVTWFSERCAKWRSEPAAQA
jgi:hypothetical protein